MFGSAGFEAWDILQYCGFARPGFARNFPRLGGLLLHCPAVNNKSMENHLKRLGCRVRSVGF